MGATLEFVQYESHDLEKIKTLFKDDVNDIEREIIQEYMWEEDCDEDEVDMECLMYTGTIYELQSIGKVHSQVVDSVEDAEKILCDKHNKWDSAMVVKINNGTSLVGGWCSC